MVRKVILGFVLLGVCGFATAAESKASGFYVGGAAGYSIFDDGGAAGGAVFDDESTSLQFHAGYKILKHLSVEGRLVDFGTFDVDVDVTAASVHAIGIIPFGDSGWELFGQLGLGTLTFKAPGFTDTDEDVFAGGIGVRYWPTRNFSLAVQTDVYVWESDRTGSVYDLSVGGTQFSVQFIF